MPSKMRTVLLICMTMIALIFVWGILSYAETTNYIYDELNRLKRVEYEDGTVIEYTYDKVGNRLQVTVVTGECSNPPAKIGTTFYTTLQEAYNTAVNGDTIKSRNVALTESLTVNRDITVTLEGGYDCNYTTNTGGMTTIKGVLTTTAGGGTITIKNLILGQ